MRILLLNPPAKKKILRDYFCSESSKVAYYWPPIASFNVFVPRYGTPLRRQLQKEGKIFIETDIDSSEKAFNLTSVSDARLYQVHQKAIREFYMRPSYIWDRLRNVNSFIQLKYLIRNGCSLLQKI